MYGGYLNPAGLEEDNICIVKIYYLGVVQWVERYIWDVEVARSSRAIQTFLCLVK